MADPGTIIGVVSLGIQVCKGITAYYSGVQDAKDDVIRMLGLVGRLNSHLKALQHVLNKQPELDAVLTVQLSEAENSVRGAVLKLKKYLDKLHKTSIGRQVSMSVTSRLIYPFKESTVAKLKETCIIAGDSLSAALSLVSMDADASVKSSLTELSAGLSELTLATNAIADDTKIIKEEVLTAHAEQRHSKLQDVHRELWQWLSPVGEQSKTVQASCLAAPGRQEASANVILNSKTFKGWHDGPPTWLWCVGPKGVGKTMCTSAVIRHLHTRHTGSSDTAIAYIYCNYKRIAEQNPANLLGTVLQQLLEPSAANVALIEQLRERSEASHSRPDPHDMIRILNNATRAMRKLYLVVDAVDELTEQSALSFLSLIHKGCPSLHVFAFSRHESPSTLSGDIPIDTAPFPANMDAIASYVQQRLESSHSTQALLERDRTLADAFVSTVVNQTKPIFLLARLYMESLLQVTNLRALRATLERPPQELSDAFQESIDRISQQSDHRRTLGLRVLSWVFHLEKPMKITQLARFLAIRTGDKYLDVDGVEEVDLLLQVSGGLVAVDAKGFVNFIHLSVQEFLSRHANRIFGQSLGCNDIASALSTYLAFPSFPGPGLYMTRADSDSGSDTNSNSNSDSDPDSDSGSGERVAGVECGQILSWTEVHDLENMTSSERKDCFRDLEVLYSTDEESNFVVDSWAMYVKRCTDRHVFDEVFELLTRPRLCALYIILRNKLVELKVNTSHPHSSESLSYVNTCALYFAYPPVESSGLIIAAEIGSLDLFKRLALIYTDLNASEPFYGRSILHMAVIHNNVEIVRFLLEHQVNIDVKDRCGKRALLEASEGGFQNLVDLLVDHHADTNIHDFETRQSHLSGAGDAIMGKSLHYVVDYNVAAKIHPTGICRLPLTYVDFIEKTQEQWIRHFLDVHELILASAFAVSPSFSNTTADLAARRRLDRRMRRVALSTALLTVNMDQDVESREKNQEILKCILSVSGLSDRSNKKVGRRQGLLKLVLLDMQSSDKSNEEIGSQGVFQDILEVALSVSSILSSSDESDGREGSDRKDEIQRLENACKGLLRAAVLDLQSSDSSNDQVEIP